MKSNEQHLQKPLTDEAIILLYWNRDESAISATSDKYGRYLFTIASNILHDAMDSEECVNDTYLSTWNKIPPTKPTIFQAFLSKLTRNIAIDKFRENNAAKRIPMEMTTSLSELDACIPSETTVEDEIFVKDVSGILNTFLNEQNRRSQIIFICRYYFFDSVASIASMLKISDRTVFRELEKLREGLKDRLKAEGYWNA